MPRPRPLRLDPRASTLLLLVLLAAFAHAQEPAPRETGAPPDTEPASRPVSAPAAAARICAEWEPALGALIAWPFKIPDALVVELARDDRLWVLASSEEAVAAARARLAELGADLEQVTVLASTVQTEWTRDYGAHSVFDAEGALRLLDSVYINTPMFRRGDPPLRKGDAPNYLGQSYPGDDRANDALAESLGLPLVAMDAYLTGGNFLVDGCGNAFSTRAMVDENNVLRDEDAFRAMVREHTGVADLRILDNTEPYGIQHIDCWMKLLDAETILVKRAPADHPEHGAIEKNLETLAALRTPFGRPYRIVRIDCPRYRGNRIAAYTNSLILNRKVLVPLFGISADAEALETYRHAMPGFEVHGFAYDGWRDFDALHCRVRAVFDPGMLRVTHAAVRDGAAAGAPIPIEVTVRAYSGAPLVAGEQSLFWRLVGQDTWRTVPLLSLAGSAERFGGEIPPQAAGAAVEYWISAADGSGRGARSPRSAPQGQHTFRVAE